MQNLIFRSLTVILFLAAIVAFRSYGVGGGNEPLQNGQFHATRLWLRFDAEGTSLSEVYPGRRTFEKPEPVESEPRPLQHKGCDLTDPGSRKCPAPGA